MKERQFKYFLIFLVKKVKQYQVGKNSVYSYVKFDHNSDFTKFNVIDKYDSNFLNSIQKQCKPIGLSENKIKGLKELLNSIDKNYLSEYNDMFKEII